MTVYRVLQPFIVQPLGLELAVNDIVYSYTSQTKVVFALNPPPVPDPETNFIDGTEWENDSFHEWVANASSAFLNDVNTITDPSSGGSGDIAAGSEAIPNGNDSLTVVYAAALSALPTAIVVTVRKPISTSDNIFAIIREDSVTLTGFTVDFSAPVSTAGFFLDYRVS